MKKMLSNEELKSIMGGWSYHQRAIDRFESGAGGGGPVIPISWNLARWIQSWFK